MKRKLAIIILVTSIASTILYGCGNSKDISTETEIVTENEAQPEYEEEIHSTEQTSERTVLYEKNDISIVDGSNITIVVSDDGYETKAEMMFKFENVDKNISTFIVSNYMLNLLDVDTQFVMIFNNEELYTYMIHLNKYTKTQDSASKEKYGDFLDTSDISWDSIDKNIIDKILSSCDEIEKAINREEISTEEINASETEYDTEKEAEKLSIQINAFDENIYSQDDETSDDTYNVGGYYKQLQIYKLPVGTYTATYMYQYPTNKGMFLVASDEISNQDGENMYYPFESVWSTYHIDTTFELKDNEHIEIEDGGFTFTKID